MPSHTPFNLITASWLPVRRRSGARAIIRPAELADASDDPIVAFEWGRADFDAAARELVIGPAGARLCRRAGRRLRRGFRIPPGAQAIDARLAPYRDAFNLDGNRPRFLQDLEEFGGEVNPIERLFIDGPSENAVKLNKDIFQKRRSIQVVSRPAAAMAVFTMQAYSPGGGRGVRTSVRGGGPLTTLVRPRRQSSAVWEVLLLNTPQLLEKPSKADWALAFPWCGRTRTSEKDLENMPSTHSGDIHPAQALFGMPRRIRLQFEKNDGDTRCDLTGRLDEALVRTYCTRPHGVNYGAISHPLTPTS